MLECFLKQDNFLENTHPLKLPIASGQTRIIKSFKFDQNIVDIELLKRIQVILFVLELF